MKEENDIDDLFRSSFEDFSVVPPAAVKEAIDREIGKRQSGRMWWFLLLLLIGSGTLAYFRSVSAPEKTPVASATISGSSASSAGAHGASSATASSPETDSLASGGNAGRPDTDAPEGSEPANSAGAAGQNATPGTNPVREGRTGKRSARTASGSKDAGSAGLSSGKTIRSAGAGKQSARKGKGEKGSVQGPEDGNATGGNTATVGNGSDKPAPDNGTTPPANNESGNPPNDSIPQQADPGTADAGHSDDTSFEPAAEMKKKQQEPAPDLWRASLYFGPQLGFNSMSLTEQQRFSEKSAFAFSGEINRSFFNGYGLSTGIGYGTPRSETFESDTHFIDSMLVIDSIPIYGNPNFPDSITDWQIAEVWQYDTTTTTAARSYSVRLFSIPLYVTRQFAFGDRWGLLVNAGAQFSFYRSAPGLADPTLPVPQINRFGVSLLGRAHVTYQWNQWQLGAGLSGGYDLKLPVVYEGIDRRRYFITPQLSVHFIF